MDLLGQMGKIGRKMANGQLLFQALNYNYYIVHNFLPMQLSGAIPEYPEQQVEVIEYVSAISYLATHLYRVLHKNHIAITTII